MRFIRNTSLHPNVAECGSLRRLSFTEELRETMLPIAAALPVPTTQTLSEWAALWGFGKQEMRSLLRDQIEQLRDTPSRLRLLNAPLALFKIHFHNSRHICSEYVFQNGV